MPGWYIYSFEIICCIIYSSELPIMTENLRKFTHLSFCFLKSVILLSSATLLWPLAQVLRVCKVAPRLLWALGFRVTAPAPSSGTDARCTSDFNFFSSPLPLFPVSFVDLEQRWLGKTYLSVHTTPSSLACPRSLIKQKNYPLYPPQVMATSLVHQEILLRLMWGLGYVPLKNISCCCVWCVFNVHKWYSISLLLHWASVFKFIHTAVRVSKLSLLTPGPGRKPVFSLSPSMDIQLASDSWPP